MTEKEILQENADLVGGIENVPPSGDIKMPQSVVFALERARREALATREQHEPAEILVAAARPGQREQNIVRPSFFGTVLKIAAAVAVLAGVAWLTLPHSAGPRTARVVVESPVGAIASTQPEIAWRSQDDPGQKYDVWILAAEGDYRDAKASPTLFKAEKVTSPVAFAAFKPGKDNPDTELKAGTDYRVLICLADGGRLAGVPVPFRVLPPQP